MKTFLIKLSWKQQIFFVNVPQAVVDLYALSIGNDVATSPKKLVVIYNITRIIIAALTPSLPQVKLLATPVISSDEINTLNTIKLEVALAELGSHEIQLFGSNLDEISGAYYAAQLSLTPFTPAGVSHDIGFQNKNYSVHALPRATLGAQDKWLIKLSVLIDGGDLNTVFIPQHLAEYIYGERYPQFIPFKHDQYHLEIIANILNLELPKIFNKQIEVSGVSLNRLPLATYLPIKINNPAIDAEILLEANSQLTQLVHSVIPDLIRDPGFEIVNSSDADVAPAPVVSMDMRIDLPVITHTFELTAAQILQLKINDVILGINSNNDSSIAQIQCGDRIIDAKLDADTHSVIIK